MFRLVLLLALAISVRAIPVENGVEGDPEIECGPTSITVNFNTRNEFEGHVYVKGLYAEQSCRNDDGGRQVAGITLPFDSCNTRRSRSLNPKGVFVSTTVIISFHPLFITKVDRAFRIQCFYMEADKTVDTNLEVSMLTTDFRTQFVPMPICRYEIFETDSGRGAAGIGNIVEYALVGDPVYHKWTCDTETIDTFCLIVHSCYVDDTQGDRVDLINEAGCANDRYLMNNPEYLTDLMAGVEAHVFKYADRVALYFQCQISIMVKEPNDECPKPQCPEPAGRGAGNANPSEGPLPQRPLHPFPLESGDAYTDTNPKYGEPRVPGQTGGSSARNPPRRRGKRSVDMAKLAGTMDVQTTLDSLDIPSSNSQHPDFPSHFVNPRVNLRYAPNNGNFCLSPSTLVVSGVLMAVVMVSFVAALYFLIQRRK